ncbi:MAG: HD domain-containing protein [Nitrospirota bacterium]
MTDSDLAYLKGWFSDYTKSFYSTDTEDQKNIMVKVDHTENVCRNILEIAKESAISENDTRIAEGVALFHDIGRFPQYARYKTFRDADSVNHGLLGSQTLMNEKVLDRLPDEEQQIIIQAVRFHGAFSIPGSMNGKTLLFLKLIRDADKVDIYRVFIEYYESPGEERASATAFGVPDTPECSQAMLSRLLNKQIASYTDIQSENDFRLMKLSWIYDMHFDESVRMLLNRDYLDRIINKLPRTDEVSAAVKSVREYIAERLGND